MNKSTPRDRLLLSDGHSACYGDWPCESAAATSCACGPSHSVSSGAQASFFAVGDSCLLSLFLSLLEYSADGRTFEKGVFFAEDLVPGCRSA